MWHVAKLDVATVNEVALFQKEQLHHPIWNVDIAFFSSEFEYAAMRQLVGVGVLQFEKHWILNVHHGFF
jgi:hypothetical protein